jgi:hypothetical protein
MGGFGLEWKKPEALFALWRGAWAGVPAHQGKRRDCGIPGLPVSIDIKATEEVWWAPANRDDDAT